MPSTSPPIGAGGLETGLGIHQIPTSLLDELGREVGLLVAVARDGSDCPLEQRMGHGAALSIRRYSVAGGRPAIRRFSQESES